MYCSDTGILLRDLAISFWGPPGEDSISLYDFYISILTTIGLMIEIESNYFLPSLRLEYNTNKPTVESDSMIIRYNVSLIPFHKQCEFVAVFTNMSFKDIDITLKFKPCAYYNVVKFECISKDDKVIAVASVRFRCEYLEIFLTGVTKDRTVYSVLKTSCIQVLHKLCADYEALRYRLAIVCPESEEGEPHFIMFDPVVPHISITCDECDHKCDVSSHPAGNWVSSAYLGDVKTAIHPKGESLFAHYSEISYSLLIKLTWHNNT